MKYMFFHMINIFLTACVTEFNPEINEKSNNLVVEGMITDQDRSHKVKISRAIPVGSKVVFQPLKGCDVTIKDENGIEYYLIEKSAGIYSTDSVKFCSHVGGIYTLKVNTGNLTYVSYPVEMMPVPPIDSLFYEKKVEEELNEWGNLQEGCQIYLNTYDLQAKCDYFRWEYTETWEFRLHWGNVINHTCWKTQRSNKILIKSTTGYNQSRVTKFPLRFISNVDDMLSVKYSILVNQYSLNEDEFNFWEKLQNISDNALVFNDITPSVIRSNIYNIDAPEEVILGYFSVSALTNKRIFIEDTFSGPGYVFAYCPTDTVWGEGDIIGLNDSLWLLEDHPLPDLYTGTEFIRWRVLTKYRECADCTTRGTTVKPPFWDQNI